MDVLIQDLHDACRQKQEIIDVYHGIEAEWLSMKAERNMARAALLLVALMWIAERLLT